MITYQRLSLTHNHTHQCSEMRLFWISTEDFFFEFHIYLKNCPLSKLHYHLKFTALYRTVTNYHHYHYFTPTTAWTVRSYIKTRITTYPPISCSLYPCLLRAYILCVVIDEFCGTVQGQSAAKKRARCGRQGFNYGRCRKEALPSKTWKVGTQHYCSQSSIWYFSPWHISSHLTFVWNFVIILKLMLELSPLSVVPMCDPIPAERVSSSRHFVQVSYFQPRHPLLPARLRLQLFFVSSAYYCCQPPPKTKVKEVVVLLWGEIDEETIYWDWKISQATVYDSQSRYYEDRCKNDIAWWAFCRTSDGTHVHGWFSYMILRECLHTVKIY